MAVRRGGNFLSQLRLDTMHMRAIESAVRNDFDELIKGLFTGQDFDQSYVIRGLRLNAPGAIGNAAKSLTVIIADSAVIHGASNTSGTFYITPPSAPVEILDPIVNPNVQGSFSPNTINYVSLDFYRQADTSTAAPQAFWDATNKVDFSQIAPLAETMGYRFIIQTGAFAANTLPLYKVQTGPANDVVNFSDERPRFTRLGRAGLSGQNPTFSYPWPEGRTENNSTATASGQNPFYGGDKAIDHIKDWFDAVMTEFKTMKGSAYWYALGSTLIPDVNLSDLFSDGQASVITGSGKFVNSNVIPGELSWTSDLTIKSTLSNLEYNIPVGSVVLQNGQTAYIDLERNVSFQPANSFTFENGSTSVVAATTITGIAVGNYIKAEDAPLSAWARVQSVSGSNIVLETPYTGPDYTGVAVMAVDQYVVQAGDPDSIPTSSNIYWLAHRRDSLAPAATINTLTRVSEITTVETSGNHSFSVGEAVTISGTSDSTFDGNFIVLSIPAPNQFTVSNDEPDTTATGGTVVTRSRIYLRGLGEISAGEEQEIGDNTVLNIISYVGMESETQSSPTYNSPHRNITQGQNLTAAISSLDRELDKFFGQLQIKPTNPASNRVIITGADYTMLDGRGYSQEISNLLMSFDGGQIDFETGDIYASDGVTPIGVTFTPPVTPAGNWRWFSVSLVPSLLTANGKLEVSAIVIAASTSNADKNLALRAPFGGTKKLGEVAIQAAVSGIEDITAQDIVQLGVGSGSGSGDGYIAVDLHDVYSTTLPSGPSAVVDGVAVSENDIVLFSNLSSGANQIFTASGVGTSITWQPVNAFEFGSTFPQNGAQVKILLGDAYRDMTAIFRETYWSFNDVVRHFNEQGDYYEVSSPRRVELVPSTTIDVFTIGATGSENLIVDFSVVRGTLKRTGQLFITHNGTDVSTSTQDTYIGDAGVSFESILSGTDLILQVEADGSPGTPFLVYSVKRWSDISGGPNSTLPSYSVMVSNPTGNSQTAFVMSDGSGIPVNISLPYTVLGKTRVDLAFTYVPGLLPGTTFGDTEVYVDGKFLPRYVANVTMDDYYIEIDSQTIELSTDMSVYPVSIEVRKRLYVGDTTPLINRQNALYDVIVGNSAQVLSGAATHTSIAAAIAACPIFGSMLILSGTYTENITVNKAMTIQGQGVGSIIVGAVLITGAVGVDMEKVRINGNVQLAVSTQACYVRGWRLAGSTLTNSGTDNLVTLKEI